MENSAGPRKAELQSRNCESCGAAFQPSRSRQIYCSIRCSNNGPKATATRLSYRARPEVQERIRASRRLATSSDVERQRQYNLRTNLSKYGMTVEEYQAKLAEQDEACAICGHIPNGVKAAARLHVDHDHVTDANRGLLCHRCNPGIGYFRDDPNLLRIAADYIERHRA